MIWFAVLWLVGAIICVACAGDLSDPVVDGFGALFLWPIILAAGIIGILGAGLHALIERMLEKP